MTQYMLTQALQKAKDTREVVIAPGALQQVDAVITRCFGGQAVALVADDNTYTAAGEALARHLESAGRRILVTHVFPGTPRLHPDIEHVERLVQVLGNSDAAPIAVGSGVINDLTKLAAHRLGRPYAVVGTAASMDGYTAFAAAITHNGVKKVDACPAPRALIADLDVLAAAPPGMSAAGYGDLLGKYTALADWRIAHDLGIETIEPVSWQLMEEGLGPWTGNPDGVRAGDPASLRDLVEGLVIAGLAMQISSSTRAASGSEHLFSHLWEMQGLTHQGEGVPHGMQVGLGTIASSALIEWLLVQDLSRLPLMALCRDWPDREQAEADVRRAHSPGAQADQAVTETLAKHPTVAELRARLERAGEAWPALSEWLRSWALPPCEARDRLDRAGCPTDPRSIGLDFNRLRQSYSLARQVRKRYTVLDLALETGLLEPGLESLFSAQGFWGGGLAA
jgi:glycerol-1-phosphate dehydrogenase [NAD(P)+]